jgi:peptide deformylase
MFPDPRLRRPAAAVSEFGPDLARLASDVADTLGAVAAIGLTAPHVGELQRVLVTRLRDAGLCEPGRELGICRARRARGG